ncbi:nucleotidyltransferase [Vulgatibacter incomptus]|uniref:Nucleotidyltransferase family protein n=1 Tax=Vulgatibacter incomptus TaxID=1391653 RepID=A0A0K1P9M3_9BACT|nr:nucleotidyltransferase [Vulgatibacter incomptus]AKU90210.1 hypothetical protein AKJ08_0597 [Vulgatibacter incomptus]
MADPIRGEEKSTRRAASESNGGRARQVDQRPAIERGAHLLALSTLKSAEIPFVVAGAYALHVYTGIYRETKDLDIFLRRQDVDRALEVLAETGFKTSLLDPVWLAKAYATDNYFADLIFSSGNGVAVVDDIWLARAQGAVIHGLPVLLAAPEEIIWSKAFVCERERFDGADVNHIILACGDKMDWRHLLDRFEPYWEILLAHMIMYRFSYPGQRDRVPQPIFAELLERSRVQANDPAAETVCRGLLLSRAQYRVDLEHWGYRDARMLEVEGFRANRQGDPARGGR